MLGATAALIGRQLAVGVNLLLEALEELLARWPGTGAAVVCSAP